MKALDLSYAMSISRRDLGTKGDPRLLCGFDFMRSRPSDKGGVIEINFSDCISLSDEFLDGFISKQLPLLKSLLHTSAVRCERSDRSILVRPIPDDNDQYISVFSGHSITPSKVQLTSSEH